MSRAIHSIAQKKRAFFSSIIVIFSIKINGVFEIGIIAGG